MAIPMHNTPSPNLGAVAAFSQARVEQDNLMLMNGHSTTTSSNMMDHLNDPPPPSSLQPRPASSRRTLTRALELAREAVQLDAANDNPEAAVKAYGLSVALLSEVMERVRRGEDSTENRRRNGRRRSSAAQEEEVRRLKNIHDTYADRMNILSIIYSIPPVPYPTSSTLPSAGVPAPESSPSPDSAEFAPQAFPSHVANGHEPDDGAEAIGSMMFALDNAATPDTSASYSNGLPGLPPASHIAHPYAQPSYESHQNTPSSSAGSRSSILARRSRAGSSALPPPAPPPSNALPPAPASEGVSLSEVNASLLQAAALVPPPGKLDPLQEDEEASAWRESMLGQQDDNAGPSAIPANVIVPRPRGSSTLHNRTELTPQQQQQLMINTTPSMSALHMRRSKSSAPPESSRSASPAESLNSASSGPAPRPFPNSVPGSSAASVVGLSRSRSSSQPGRPPPFVPTSSTSPPDPPPLPPQPVVSPPVNGSASAPRRSMFLSKSSLMVQTDLAPPSQLLGLPTTPTSPLPPPAPSDPLRKPYFMMNLLLNTMDSSTGGYVTRRLHVPQEVWSQGGAQLANTLEKVRAVGIICQALEELQMASSEFFGAGNVSSGLAAGIGSVGKKEAEAWLGKLDEFSGICEGVVANFGKKLRVGEGFVTKKSTWGDRVSRRFDKFTNGKNLDSPQAYTDGLRRLFHHVQLLDEHTQAVFSAPVAASYSGFPPELRMAVETKLKRNSQFFASVVLTFVVRDLSMLLDKYVKTCEKWLEA